MATLLFLYGTLKRGQRNHALLAGQEYLGPASTPPRFVLYHCGPYPGLVLADNEGVAVDGELWRVDDETLRRLDTLEQVPTVFDRREISLPDRDGPVFAYFYVKDTRGFPRCECWPP